MASITQRLGRYFVRVRVKGFPIASKTFTRRSDAVVWGRKVQADMEAGRWRPLETDIPTLTQAIGDYKVNVATRMKGAADYAYRLNQFAALPFAKKRIDEVTPVDLAKWRDDLACRVKPATVVRQLAMMASIFTWAMKDRGWTQSNPACMVSRPRVNDRRERVLSVEEQSYLVRAAETSKAKWLAPALTLLMNSAMRRGELFSLRRMDVNFGSAVAHLPDTKNGSARDVPLCPKSLAAVRDLAVLIPNIPTASMVPVGVPGSISTRFTKTLRRARRLYEDECKSTGLKPEDDFLTNLRLHDLRHHAITLWASTGALSVLHLQAISGHKTARMLSRYTHLSATALAAKLAEISVEA